VTDRYPCPPRPARGTAAWAVTLADLALLLVGFLVLTAAIRPADRDALARSMRARFGEVDTAPAVAAAAETGFAPGSARLADGGARLVPWAREQAADPRVRLTVTGSTDGTAADRDPATGSAELLAADRARAAAAAIAAAVPGARLSVRTSPQPLGRGAWVSASFAGE